MTNRSAFIPYGAYWSTPFARWQGALSHLHSLRFAAWHAKRELAARGLQETPIDMGVLGTTVPQQGAFYGLPWLAGMMGLDRLAGPTVSQACATSARAIAVAADAVRAGSIDTAFLVMADRVSNGPSLYYPDPSGPGGNGTTESWVMDNFACDPYAQLSMLQTAENVAKRYGVGTAEQDEVTLIRYGQYAAATGFRSRYMRLPFEVPDKAFRKTVATLQDDEGVHATTAEGLAKLKPVLPDGAVTFGGQTHPADGNAAMFVCSDGRAKEISTRPEVRIEVVGLGQAREEKGFMPAATVPAARAALAQAGVKASDVTHLNTHNPFVVTDIVVSRELGFPVEKMNGFGCSLVWGHPQGPTGMRSVIELVEQMVQEGGGIGLFTGCAAGDSAMAVLLRVDGA